MVMSPKMDDSEIVSILTTSAGPFAVETFGGERFYGFRTDCCPHDTFKFNDISNEDLEHVHLAREIRRLDRVSGDVKQTKWPCRQCQEVGERQFGRYVGASAVPINQKPPKTIAHQFECPKGHQWCLEGPHLTE
jgi:hypothetical protein